MGLQQGLEIGMEGSHVIARYGDERIGRICVPELRFQWCEATYVPMGGVAGVGTEKRFRQRGIARSMMQQAVAYARDRGCVCGGVSTGTANAARRLYSGAGYAYVFSMQGCVREPGRRRVRLPQHIQIRGYEAGDEQALTQLRCRIYGAFFGCRKPMHRGGFKRAKKRWMPILKAFWLLFGMGNLLDMPVTSSTGSTWPAICV